MRAAPATSAFIDRLWPALEAAMAWIDGPGDSNGDGFIDYARTNQIGLVNQGWKDSVDSIFHDDGRMAEPPIALVEVQGYVYAARMAMAWLAKRRGELEKAREWQRQAKALRVAVERRFWLADLGFYAIAIDGSGQPCRVRASNAGHLLYSGLPSAAARSAGDRRAPVGGVRQRLGRAHARAGSGAVQSDVLPQRVGVAARHGALRGRYGGLRRAARRRASR